MRWAEVLPSPSPVPAPSGSLEGLRGAFDIVGPIAGTGLVGALFLMVLFRYKLMPTYVHDDYKVDAAKRLEEKDGTIGELKEALREANAVYTAQVIPTLTRVLDAERELVDLRRDEQSDRRRRDQGGRGG